MKTLIVVVLSVVMLTGCEEGVKSIPFNAMPAELSDCKIYRIQTSAGPQMMVMRCPNSTTSVRHGKNTTSTVEISSEEVEAQKKHQALSKLSDEERKLLGL